MIQEVKNYDALKTATPEQQAAYKQAQTISALKGLVEQKRGYTTEITIPAEEKAKRRAKNKAAKASRKRNRRVS